MRRRLFVASSVGVLLIGAAILAVRQGHDERIPSEKSEEYYQGRPASYWSARIKALPITPYYDSWKGLPRDARTRPADLVEEFRKSLGLPYRKRAIVQPLRDGDPAAIPVLIELLHERDPTVRMYAAETLGSFKSQGKEAKQALKSLLTDEEIGGFGLTVGERAAWALAEIGDDD